MTEIKDYKMRPYRYLCGYPLRHEKFIFYKFIFLHLFTDLFCKDISSCLRIRAELIANACLDINRTHARHQ